MHFILFIIGVVGLYLETHNIKVTGAIFVFGLVFYAYFYADDDAKMGLSPDNMLQALVGGIVNAFNASIGSMLAPFLGYNKAQENKFVAYCLGFAYAQNSALNNSYIYKTIWDDVYESGINSYQIKAFFKVFQKGKKATRVDLEKHITDNKALWEKDPNYAASLYTKIITIFFLDGLVTQNEMSYIDTIARLMDISDTIKNRIFQSFINKYQYEKDEYTGNYTSTFGFSFEEKENDYGQDQSGYNQQDQYSNNDQYNSNNQYNDSNNQYSNNSSYNPFDAESRKKLYEAYVLLQIDENTPETDAKRAYHKLMHRYHPDRAYGKNLSPEEVEQYKILCQKIQQAWDLIKEVKHW